MARWNDGSREVLWHEADQVAAQRAVKAFMEWCKTFLLAPLPEASDRVGTDLCLAAAEMMMGLVYARAQSSAAGRAGCFRDARRQATRCAALLETPEALHLTTAEDLEHGRELLEPVFAVLGRLIHPPPDGPGTHSASRPRPPRPGAGGLDLAV